MAEKKRSLNQIPSAEQEDETHAEDCNTHHKPQDFGDRFAFRLVKFLRFFADAFFAKRYGHRAVVLETVAAVPGMVGGMLLHLKSLRKMKDDEGWIRTLLDEAENERMHLMTFVEIAKPTWFERLIVIVAQSLFYIAYLILYLISSKTAHRVVGYLEEEAVASYTEYLEQIQKGEVENITAPDVAIKYWDLSQDAKLIDVVNVIRADEMAHREVNHCIADKLGDKDCDVHTSDDMSVETRERLEQYRSRRAP